MYFCLEGKIGIGFSIFSRGLDGKQYRISKSLKKTFMICDHYVINNKRCEFIYLVMKPIKCFALTKKFLQREIFPRYPEIAAEMKSEALLRYKKTLKGPITEHMHKEYETLNKKSLTRVYEFRDKKSHGTVVGANQSKKLNGTGGRNVLEEVKKQLAAEDEMQEQLNPKGDPLHSSERLDSDHHDNDSIDAPLNQAAKLAKKREKELQLNVILKQKLDSIQEDMKVFGGCHDKLSRLCNREMATLLGNLDNVALSMEKLIKKHQMTQGIQLLMGRSIKKADSD
jgi:hypothetical protein